MGWYQMSSDASTGVGLWISSLCCSGFSKGTMMSVHFFSLIKMWSSFKEKPGCRAQAGAAWVQVMALQSGGAWWADEAWSLRLPGPSWATAHHWDRAGNHIPSLPCPAHPSPLAWLRISLFQRHDQLLNEAARWIIFLREREKIKIKLTYFNRFPGSGPTVNSKLWCNSHQKQ